MTNQPEKFPEREKEVNADLGMYWVYGLGLCEEGMPKVLSLVSLNWLHYFLRNSLSAWRSATK